MGNVHCCMRPDKKTENNIEAKNLFSRNKNIYRNDNNLKEKSLIDLNQISLSDQYTGIKNLSQNNNNNNNQDEIKEIKDNTIDDRDIFNNKEYILKNEEKIKKIQKQYRAYLLKSKFKNEIKTSLSIKTSNFVNKFYSYCSKFGEIEEDKNFSIDNYKKYYPENDPFFLFNKGKVFKNQIRLKNINDPENLEIYKGETNLKNLRHGYGILTTPQYIMKGTWRNDEFTGWGQKLYRNGDIYEGKFIDGKIKGKGIFKNKQGNVYKGDFYNDMREGKGDLITDNYHYIGEFKNNKLNGKGKIEFIKEGKTYEGEFENNEINGKGIYKWKNGDIYEGQMKKGKMHGYGKYCYNDGKIYEGEYINGIKNGKGKFIYSKNKYYEGLFLEGYPNGEGFYTEDGNISKVLFSKGEFIKFIS